MHFQLRSASCRLLLAICIMHLLLDHICGDLFRCAVLLKDADAKLCVLLYDHGHLQCNAIAEGSRGVLYRKVIHP